MINKIKRWFEKRHKEKLERIDKAHLNLTKFVVEMDRIEQLKEKNIDRVEKLNKMIEKRKKKEVETR